MVASGSGGGINDGGKDRDGDSKGHVRVVVEVLKDSVQLILI